MTILAPDTLSERTANCYELLGLAEEVQDETIRFDAAFHRGGTALEAGDADAANDMVDVAARVAEPAAPAAVPVAGAPDADRAGGVPRCARRRRVLRRRSARARPAVRAGRDAFLFHTEQHLEIRRWQGRLDEHLDQLQAVRGPTRLGLRLRDHALPVRGRRRRSPRSTSTAASWPGSSCRCAATCSWRRRCTTSRSSPRVIDDATTAVGLYDALRPFADSFANTTVAKPVGWHFLGMLAATMGKVDDGRVLHAARRSPCTRWSARRCSEPRARSSSPASCSTTVGMLRG